MGDVSIILFYSKRSRPSAVAMELMAKADIETINVCLDGKSMRDRVLKGPYVQIRQVPTVAIAYPTGKVDIYSGLDKITAIANAMTQRRRAAIEPEVPLETVPTTRRKRKNRTEHSVMPVANMYPGTARAAASRPEPAGAEIEIETTIGDDDDESEMETEIDSPQPEAVSAPVDILQAAKQAERDREMALEQMKQTFAQGQ